MTKDTLTPSPKHILLTALGGRAIETIYELNGRTQSALLAPLALIRFLGPTAKPDRVFALVTQGARKETWDVFSKEVREILDFDPEPIDIPDGRSPDEVRRILEKVASRIPEGVDLTLDVTHGYRHFPLLIYALALYLQSLRGVRIRGAYYGMLESREKEAARPILDLQPLLDLPGWFHAVQVFRDTGVTTPIAQMARPLAERLRRQAREAENDRNLHERAGSVERFIRGMEELSQAYESGLPLELGKVATSSEDGGLTLPKPLVGNLPLADGLERMLDEAIEPYRFAKAPGSKGKWKKRVILDEEELNRQTRLIETYLDRSQLPLAVGLLREWVVSWVLCKGGRRTGWLNKKDREEAESWLNSLSKYVEKEKNDLSETQKKWGEFWNDLRTLRNRLHHHGMDEETLPHTLKKIVSFWCSIRSGRTDLPALGGGSGRLLITAQGNRPGVLFSALRASRPDRCLVICSKKSRPSVVEAAGKAGFSGDIETAELADPFAGYDERKRIVESARRLLLEADEVVVNLTGGTTVMGIVAQALVDEARALARPCRRLVLVDRRPPEEQEADPYVESEFLWLDEKDKEGASG